MRYFNNTILQCADLAGRIIVETRQYPGLTTWADMLRPFWACKALIIEIEVIWAAKRRLMVLND